MPKTDLVASERKHNLDQTKNDSMPIPDYYSVA